MVYRAGLVKLLTAAGADVVHESASGAELLARLARDRPDVVVLDIRMSGDEDGLATADEIRGRHPDVGVLVLSAHAQTVYAERLFVGGSAGRGYMLKENLNNVAALKEALGRIHRRQTYSDPEIVDRLLASQRGTTIGGLLTARELDVLKLLASGASNAAIATDLNATTGAIEATISSVYSKLGIPDEPEYNRRVLAVLRWLREAQQPHRPA